MSEPVFVRETRLPIDDLQKRVAWFRAQHEEATQIGVTYDRRCQDGERMLFEGWYERPGFDGPERGLGAPRWKQGGEP
jgi:hypothetical protein